MAGAVLIVLAVLVLALSAIAIVYVLGIRSQSAAVRTAARRFHHGVGNPLQMRSAGTPGTYAAVIILVTLATRKATSGSKPPRSSRCVVPAAVQPSGRWGVSTPSRHRWSPGRSRPAAVSATTPFNATAQRAPSAESLMGPSTGWSIGQRGDVMAEATSIALTGAAAWWLDEE